MTNQQGIPGLTIDGRGFPLPVIARAVEDMTGVKQSELRKQCLSAELDMLLEAQKALEDELDA